MDRSVPNSTVVSKGNPVDRAEGAEDKLLVLEENDQDNSLVRRLLRKAIDESTWKDGAVAEAIGLKGESGASYFSKMLSGEKPIGSAHLRALPDDIEAIFARLYAEHFGLIVVAPVYGDDAIRNLVSGIFGVLSSRLPAKAHSMAHAVLRPTARKVRA